MAVRGHGPRFWSLGRSVLLVAALLALHPALTRVQAQTPPVLATLPGHTLLWLAGATPLTAAAAATEQPLTLTFVLKRTDEAGFQSFLNAVADPASPQYQQFLSQQQLADRFGPTQARFDQLKQYLTQQGLTAVSAAESRLTLTVRGTRAQAEQALNVRLRDYRLGSRSFFANDRDPSLPGALAAGVRAVAGLTNFALPRHAPGAQVAAGSAPQPYAPASLATAYDAAALGSGISGAGQKIGLLEFDNFSPSDVAAWLAFAGLPASQINQLSTVDVNGGTTPTQGSGTGEVLLDIATVMGIARGATYVVYDTGNSNTSFQDMLTAMINDHDAEISVSWFYCESQTTAADVDSIDAIVQGATASGISVFAATDDAGNACNTSSDIAVPADGPHVTAVGGTSLYVTAGNVYANETYWNNSGSGGYGSSVFFAAPAYQAGLSGKAWRSIPDVAADGDPSTGIELCQAVVTGGGGTGGCPEGFGGGVALWGGTSMATPIWAAGMALINQKLGHLTGNLNATLYPLQGGSGFHAASSMGTDFAHVGLGSFDLGRLYTVLSGGGTNFTLTLSSNGCGATSPTGAVTHSSGDPVSVTATPCDSGHTFSGWTATGASCTGGASTSPCAFSMPAGNVTLAAAFSATQVPAVLTNPTPGSTLAGSAAAFSWTGVSGAQQYVLWVGTAAGKSDLFWGSAGTGTSVTATALPTDGRTLSVQLWTLFSSGWFSDAVHTYTAANGPAVLTTPAPGSTLNSGTVQFKWTGVTGAQQYVLWVGTAAGKSDLFWGSAGTGTSITPSGLPADGRPLSVQLWTLFTSGWYSDGVHSYTAATQPAMLTSPAPGTTLVGSTVPFSWTGVPGAQQYVLWVGTATGKSDLFWGSNGTATSVTATSLPADGRTLYLQLWTLFPAGWYSDSVHTYTAFSAHTPAVLSTPAPGTTLSSGTVTFSWTGVSGAQQYVLWVGTAAGKSDLFWGSAGTGTSITPAGLPADGRTLYIQLWTLFPSGWYGDSVHSYTAAQGPAALTNPAPGSMLSGSSVSFSWTGVNGAQQYVLWVGTAAGKSDLFWGSAGTGTSVTATGLPRDGRTLYIQLWTLFSSGWQSDGIHPYTASTAQVPAVLSTPVPGSTLAGSSAAFSWSGVNGAQQYVLWVGTAAGKSDLFWGSNGTGTSVTATGLPTDGRTVSVQLWTLFSSGWQSDGVHTFTAAG